MVMVVEVAVVVMIAVVIIVMAIVIAVVIVVALQIRAVNPHRIPWRTPVRIIVDRVH